MKIPIMEWMEKLTGMLKEEFGQSLLFVGLQGSYRRGEATQNSDIDIVVILEQLSLSELKRYRMLIRSMPYKEKACGFICGKEELQSWPKYDLFQLCYDTKAFYGTLDSLVPEIEQVDIADAVRINAANLYHMACHSFLFAEDKGKCLKDLYKGAFYLLQARCFLKTGKYGSTKAELLDMLEGVDREILETGIYWDGSEANIDHLYQKLIQWCGNYIK